MDKKRLEKQIDFLSELDKLKTIIRRSYICGGERRENSAEHSWHTALMALLLAEYADTPIDAARAAKMMLVHDIVEIDAGDTFIYGGAGSADQPAHEAAAAERIFGLLPGDQAAELLALWREFEAAQTPEARFAKAVDRLMPLLHNYQAQGRTWKEHGVTAPRVKVVNAKIAEGSGALWSFAQELIEDACRKGYLPRG